MSARWGYQKYSVDDFILKTNENCQDKVILEIGSDMELNVARHFLEMGAKEVYCVNPKFPENMNYPDERIKIIRKLGEDAKLPSKYFDIVFGIALIEHVLNVQELISEVKRVLKPNGVGYLSGNPIYTSPKGHHIWVKTPEKHYTFASETNPFEDWEHLSFNNKEDIINSLKSKDIPHEHIEPIVNYITSNDTSKFSASEIIEKVKKVKNLNIKVYRQEESCNPNKYYSYAKNRYSEKDLNTTGLCFILRKDSFYYLKILLKDFIKGVKLFVQMYF